MPFTRTGPCPTDRRSAGVSTRPGPNPDTDPRLKFHPPPLSACEECARWLNKRPRQVVRKAPLL